jgi:hypothetical protein
MDHPEGEEVERSRNTIAAFSQSLHAMLEAIKQVGGEPLEGPNQFNGSGFVFVGVNWGKLETELKNFDLLRKWLAQIGCSLSYGPDGVLTALNGVEEVSSFPVVRDRTHDNPQDTAMDPTAPLEDDRDSFNLAALLTEIQSHGGSVIYDSANRVSAINWNGCIFVAAPEPQAEAPEDC